MTESGVRRTMAASQVHRVETGCVGEEMVRRASSSADDDGLRLGDIMALMHLARRGGCQYEEPWQSEMGVGWQRWSVELQFNIGQLWIVMNS